MTERKFFAARFILVALALFAFSVKSDAQWRWPVEGAQAGENMLLVPQQYLDSEHNFSNIIITVPLGSNVVAPADGQIQFLNVGIYTTLKSMYTSHFTQGTFDSKIDEYREQYKNLPVKGQYVAGGLSLLLADGSKIFFHGLKGDRELKSGMKVKQGEVLGSVAYCYHKVNEPSILVAVSDAGGKPADPMTPFGIKSTFKSAGEVVIPETLTAEQANEDMDVLMNAYRECYPSLDEIVTPEQFEAFDNRARLEFRNGISYKGFYDVVRASISSELVHDSHVSLLTPNPGLGAQGAAIHVPHLMMGILGDSIIVTKAERSCAGFIGKKIESIDGESAADIVARVDKMMVMYDGENESHRDNMKLSAWNYIYGNEIMGERTTVVKFSDGSEFKDVWMKNERVQYVPFTSLRVSYIKNQYMSRTKGFDFKVLNDSTVLFSLHSFVLNQVEMDRIADSLKKFAGVPNMIIDVRNNPGGDVRIINRLVSFFLEKPSEKQDSYLKVNSNGKYESFKYALNYLPDHEIFQDYKAIEGKDGFYAPSDYYDAPIEPDSLVHYPGRVYLLTDESSVSAATVFPALIVRNRRGVTVGRETLSGYHYMTAYKFVNIMLPNSRIQLRIPLVKDVFDDAVTPRTPKGRGLMPDYEVPLTYEEIFTAEKDLILQRALDLIADGEYLGEDYFSAENGGSLKLKENYLLYGAAGAGLVGIGWLVALRMRRKK